MPDTTVSHSAWVHRDERLPDVARRILALSPIYPTGHEMRHRMMDARFFRICTEATHWLDVQLIEPGEPDDDPFHGIQKLIHSLESKLDPRSKAAIELGNARECIGRAKAEDEGGSADRTGKPETGEDPGA